MGRKIVIATLAVAATLALTESLIGWPWSTDMYYQPSIRPLEQSPMPPVEGTVSIDAEPTMDRNASSALTNPVSADEASLKRGKTLFENYCAVCHGIRGKGDGTIATKFATPPDITQQMYYYMTDGYIYGTIRNGGANMPPQAEALSPRDRWDVINYLRSIQQP